MTRSATKVHGLRLAAALALIPMLALAGWGQGKGHGKGKDQGDDDDHGYNKHHEPEHSGASATVVVFSTQDRSVVGDWFWQNRRGLPPGLAKRESLPPGLRKQLQRNGTLPPGLEKKLRPLPPVLEAHLVPLPPDYVRFVIGSDLVLLDRRRNLVVDVVFNVVRDPNDNDRNRYSDDVPMEAYAPPTGPDVYASRGPAPAPVAAPAPPPSGPVWHAGPAAPVVSNASPQQKPFELQVRLNGSLSTNTAKTGDRFTATLDQPIYEGSKVIARQGAQVEGRVTDSDKGGRVSGVASLTLNLTRIQTVTGKYADITSEPLIVDANSTKGKDVTKIAIVSGIGTVVGALAGGGKGAAIGAASGAAAGTGVVLATRGDPAVIPNEGLMQFSIRSY